MIELLENEEEWADFVRKNENSTIFHTLEWRDVIRKTFRYKPFYLVSRYDHSLGGVLPFFMVKSFIFGKKMISLPFSFGAGPLYKDDKTLNELLISAKVYAKDSKHIEIRTISQLGREIYKENGLNERLEDYVTAMDLEDEKTCWDVMDKKHRNAIRKSEKEGLKVRELSSDSDLKKYYKIKLNLSAKKYGIPCEPLKFFRTLWEELRPKGMIKIFLAEFEGKVVGGVILVMHKKEITYLSGAADEKYLHLKPYNLLIWEALKFGCKNGYKRFNFGTSAEQGLRDFKESWGAKSFQIPVYSTAEVSSGKAYGLFTKVWKRVPTALSKHPGSFLVKHKGG